MAPVAAAVRQATRAPDERPPTSTRQAAQLSRAELLDDRRPGLVQVRRRRRRAAAGDAVGLLDEGDGDAGRERRLSDREQVG